MQVIELVYFLIPLVPELLNSLLLAFLVRIAEGSLRKLLSSVAASHTLTIDYHTIQAIHKAGLNPSNSHTKMHVCVKK